MGTATEPSPAVGAPGTGTERQRLLWMLRTMLRIRAFDERIVTLFTAGKVAGAVHWSHGVASKWCLVAGGVWSLFLGSLVLVLPYAVTDDLVMAIGVYALVFGILVSVAALTLRRVARAPIGAVNQTWVAR